MVDGTLIRQLRKESGMTTTQLGKSVFVSQEMITQIENGAKKPSVELLARIAERFDKTVDEFIKKESWGRLD